jgi:hypothetical protein
MATVPPGWWTQQPTPDEQELLDKVKAAARAIRATEAFQPPHAFSVDGLATTLRTFPLTTTPVPEPEDPA